MSLVKKIVRSVLWRTGIGRKSAELFWNKKREGKGLRYLHYAQKDVLENIPMDFRESTFNDFLKQDLPNWKVRTEYVLEMDDVLVEPERCLGIQNFNELIEQTVVFQTDYQFPYILPYLLNRNKARRVDKAVLYDGSATRNYFHHLVDALSCLYMFERSKLPTDIPFIINRFTYDQKFFQYLLQNNEKFRAINWHVQEKNDWIRVSKLYRVQAFVFDKATWAFTRSLYNLEDVKPFRKVFLNRDKKLFSRGLSNEEEVVAMLQKHGFESYYAEHMTVDEQKKLFQETRYLVALTGMGLIQQFFMKYDEAYVLEIIPLNRLMPEYYCQAFVLGIKYYDVVLGDSILPDEQIEPGHLPKKIWNIKSYNVNLEKLESAVLRMLAAP